LSDGRGGMASPMKVLCIFALLAMLIAVVGDAHRRRRRHTAPRDAPRAATGHTRKPRALMTPRAKRKSGRQIRDLPPVVDEPAAVLMDVRTPELIKPLTPADLAAWPAPRFVGCAKAGSRWSSCVAHLENVCFSRHDGVLVPNLTEDAAKILPVYEKLHRASTPTKGKLIPADGFRSARRAYLVDGTTFAISCWRTKLDGHNPAHFMMGVGSLFAAAVSPHVPRNMSNLIFHQCPGFGHREVLHYPPEHRGVKLNLSKRWPWAQGIWSLIRSKGEATGMWSPSRVNELVLGGEQRKGEYVSELPHAEDFLFCTRDVYIDANHPGLYLNNNAPEVVAEWRAHAERLYPSSSTTLAAAAALATPSSPTAAVAAEHASDDAIDEVVAAAKHAAKPLGKPPPSKCTSLRIAIWQRGGGSTHGARSMINLQQVIRLVARFTTHRPIRVLSASEHTPFVEQMALFRSFDVLIAPHGSHLVNQMFAKPSVVVIEVRVHATKPPPSPSPPLPTGYHLPRQQPTPCPHSMPVYSSHPTTCPHSMPAFYARIPRPHSMPAFQALIPSRIYARIPCPHSMPACVAPDPEACNCKSADHFAHARGVRVRPSSSRQVVTMHVDDAPCMNGRGYTRGWVMAYGRHLPMRRNPATGAVSVLWGRANRMNSTYHHPIKGVARFSYKEDDMLVDLERMHTALTHATRIGCAEQPAFQPAGGMGPRGHHFCGHFPFWKRFDVAPRSTLCCGRSCAECRSRPIDCNATCAKGEEPKSCPAPPGEVCPSPPESSTTTTKPKRKASNKVFRA
jgi:hypothetical protein